jgi:putative nucleotidyltransferase with HDIG domain
MHDWTTGNELKKIYKKFSSTKPSNKAYIECIHALVNLAEAKDPYTKKHSLKVSNYAVVLAKAMKLPKEEVDIIKLAGLLHDVGKLGIKEKVLMKNGSLSGAEYEEIKKHSGIGAEIVKPFRFFNEVVIIIKHHHEKYGGKGYPDGLKGKHIPMGSRILAIADCYDALTSNRAYRDAYAPEQAVAIMEKEDGTKFDPEILEIFMKCITSKKG